MKNLTEFEQSALGGEVNLSDGHPRHDLSDRQQRIIDRLPEIFFETRVQNFRDLEIRAQQSFMTGLGQFTAPVADDRVFSVYSSSVTTMVVARFLRRRGHKAAIIHPTFDNIPDLLRDMIELVPVTERQLDDADFGALLAKNVTCVFVTTPNNPTGWVLKEAAFQRLVAFAAAHGLLLCFDTSFRGFDVRTQFDGYKLLEDSGIDYLVIEDTGKLWPVAELKLSFIATSKSVRADIEHDLSDVLLSVSPFVLGMVEELARESADGGYSSLHRLIADNRQEVARTLRDLDHIEMPDTESRISVCRLLFPSAERAVQVQEKLLGMNVHVLPCMQFHWNAPGEGGSHLRIALARDTKLIMTALDRLRAVARSSPGRA